MRIKEHEKNAIVEAVKNTDTNARVWLFGSRADDSKKGGDIDIREIALHESVNWAQAINDARQKEAGLELIYISDILTGMPQSEFETITWVKKPEWDEFREDINRIVFDMMNG